MKDILPPRAIKVVTIRGRTIRLVRLIGSVMILEAGRQPIYAYDKESLIAFLDAKMAA